MTSGWAGLGWAGSGAAAAAGEAELERPRAYPGERRWSSSAFVAHGGSEQKDLVFSVNVALERKG